jgi:uncharacterized membrane protein
MRKALSIIAIAVVVSIAFAAMLGQAEIIGESEAAVTPIQNTVSIYGLHVALPEYMTNFPKELVPLP